MIMAPLAGDSADWARQVEAEFCWRCGLPEYWPESRPSGICEEARALLLFLPDHFMSERYLPAMQFAWGRD